MFFRVPQIISPWMRPTYLALSALLGLLLSIGAHVLIELWWLSYAQKHGLTITWTTVLGTCSLPLWLQILLPVVGVIGGFLVGRVWWRWVYIERKWEHHFNNQKTAP